MIVPSYRWAIGPHYVVFEVDDDLAITLKIRDELGDYESTITDERAALIGQRLYDGVWAKTEPGSPEDEMLELLMAWLAHVRTERQRRFGDRND